VTTEFAFTDALRELRVHGVDFVCIGGVAAVLRGANYVTFDLDVCPDPARENLERLSTALRALDARIAVEGVDEGFAFSHDGESLARARVWNLITSKGRLDLVFIPAGTNGFADLVRDAEPLELDGVTALVASLDDLIRSKRAANREKDRQSLPILERLRDELS
jgi:hypothetical protein